MNRQQIEVKRKGNYAIIPVACMVHPERHRAVRGIDTTHVSTLKKAMMVSPLAIVAPLGINVSSIVSWIHETNFFNRKICH